MEVETKSKDNVYIKVETNDDCNDEIYLVPEFNLEEPKEDDCVMKWAENNIGENPHTKLQLIDELRDMIFERGECIPHRTDDAFLLRFLRARRFIVRMSHRLMVNYCIFRETNPELFYNLNYKKMLEVGESEVFSIPPYADQDGRRILIIRFENWDTSQLTTDELFQSIAFLIQAAILEPKHQILGGVCIIDVGNLGVGQAWYLTPSIAKKILAVAYSSLPHRVHAVHIINASKIFDYAFGILKPFLLDMMKERIFIHSDLESLHKHMSPKYLPQRYGGIHRDYPFNDWLTVLKNNEDVLEEMTLYGYEGCREFAKTL